MSDEKILGLIENQDKYYILGFIKGIKVNNELLQQENQQLKEEIEEYKRIEETDYETIRYLEDILEKFKEWLEYEYHLNLPDEFAEFECTDETIIKIYNKIKELEEGVK